MVVSDLDQSQLEVVLSKATKEFAVEVEVVGKEVAMSRRICREYPSKLSRPRSVCCEHLRSSAPQPS